jgi:hypothetical protein
MAKQVTARFVVDRPVMPGIVRAILDTLAAQGGAYAPQLVRSAHDRDPKRIAWSRPAGLLHNVGEEGSHTTFLRVAEGRPEPVLSFQISAAPRSTPSVVTLAVSSEILVDMHEIERLLGVCKGLYLFLESPLAVAGLDSGAGALERVHWANFYGPQIVTHVGPARLLTSMAFIVEILPDGGMMLISHATPARAASDDGRAMCRVLAGATGVVASMQAVLGAPLRRLSRGAPSLSPLRGVPNMPS